LRRKRLEDARGVAQSYSNLGEVAYRRGYPRRALILYRRSLVRLHALQDKELALNALNGVARALTDLGEFARALRLLTAEDYERTALRLPLPVTFRADRDRTLHDLLTGLGQAQVSLIKEQATALSLDDAIEEAIAARN
jgi:tetratricopeptide (TPR) repeat protein